MRPDAPIPPAARQALLDDLDACDKAFARRNEFIHGTWTFDEEETQSWWGIKGVRGEDRPALMQASSTEPWCLANEFDWLREQLLAWDIDHFGEDGDPDEGQPPRVSVKRW